MNIAKEELDKIIERHKVELLDIRLVSSCLNLQGSFVILVISAVCE